MPEANCCAPCNVDGVVSQVPGDAGSNSYTTTSANFTVPAIDATVSVTVGDTSWMAVGATIFVSDGVDFGHFVVQSVSDSTHATLVFSGASGDASPGAVIGSGASVAPSGGQQDLTTAELKALNTTLLSGISSFTDNTGGTASSTLAAGVGVFELSIPHTFIGGTSAVESVTNLTLGFNFKILAWHFVTEVLLVGGGGSRIANLEINSTDVGTVASTCTVAIANAAVGTVTAATAVAGNNTGDTTATLSLEIAAGGTAFSAGSGTFVIRIQNMDSANAFASLADKVNDIMAALKT